LQKRLILMQRILHAGRAYAAAYIAADVRPGWRVILPFVCAGNVIVATLAWIVVGLVSR
jgi:hypothetical protein